MRAPHADALSVGPGTLEKVTTPRGISQNVAATARFETTAKTTTRFAAGV
jgi:hypothetical protein